MSELNEPRTWNDVEPEAEALIKELRRDLERLKEKVHAFRESGAGAGTDRPDRPARSG